MIAAIWGSSFFDEAITIGKVVGIAVIMLGVFLLVRVCFKTIKVFYCGTVRSVELYLDIRNYA